MIFNIVYVNKISNATLSLLAFYILTMARKDNEENVILEETQELIEQRITMKLKQINAYF